MKVSRIVLMILLLGFIGQSVYFYPQLPETISSHFDGNGHANGFMPKISFFAFEAILIGVLLTILLSMVKLISKMPDSMINLPNKAYWLSPERRDQTLASFGGLLAWLSAMILALFIAINQIVLTAILLKKDPDPHALWSAMGIFLALLASITFLHLKRFLGKSNS